MKKVDFPRLLVAMCIVLGIILFTMLFNLFISLLVSKGLVGYILVAAATIVIVALTALVYKSLD